MLLDLPPVDTPTEIPDTPVAEPIETELAMSKLASDGGDPVMLPDASGCMFDFV